MRKCRHILAGLAVSSVIWAFSSIAEAQIVFSNPSVISIPDVGKAAPYPSGITVSGLNSSSALLSLTLSNLSHTFASDLDMLLVGPGNQAFVFMSDAGDDQTVNNLTLTFSDFAAVALPNGSTLVSGTYRPADYGTASDSFPLPAPQSGIVLAGTAGPGTFASVFGGIDPNGTWSLFIMDGFGGDSGQLAGGWSLTFSGVPEPSTWALLLLGTAALLRFQKLPASRIPRPKKSGK